MLKDNICGILKSFTNCESISKRWSYCQLWVCVSAHMHAFRLLLILGHCLEQSLKLSWQDFGYSLPLPAFQGWQRGTAQGHPIMSKLRLEFTVFWFLALCLKLYIKLSLASLAVINQIICTKAQDIHMRPLNMEVCW